MKPLFAPWRMEFIEKHDPSKGCVLCAVLKGDVEGNQIIHKGKYNFVIINKFPYSNGHIMVVPNRHEGDWTKLTRDELLDLNELTQKALIALKAALNPQGFNMGVNLGKPAGAGIETHVHQHIVPRWVGDVNFMPLLSETKQISEHLETTFKKIKKAWPNS